MPLRMVAVFGSFFSLVLTPLYKDMLFLVMPCSLALHSLLCECPGSAKVEVEGCTVGL